MDRLKRNEILETYFRKSNQSFYGTPAPFQNCIIQAEIMAQAALRKWCFQNKIGYLSIFLRVREDVLLDRLIAREDPNEDPHVRLEEDRYYDLFSDWSDVIYEYSDKTIPEGAADVIDIIEQRFPSLKK